MKKATIAMVLMGSILTGTGVAGAASTPPTTRHAPAGSSAPKGWFTATPPVTVSPNPSWCASVLKKAAPTSRAYLVCKSQKH